jgi:hypothetical protein
MFTRVVEITTKTGKSHELANTIQEKVLPILKKHDSGPHCLEADRAGNTCVLARGRTGFRPLDPGQLCYGLASWRGYVPQTRQ